MSAIIDFLLGLALLLLGRKLFWLFVGVAGFVLGITLTTSLLAGQPDWLILLIALAAGIVGAVLAIVAQQVAVALAGFVFGGFALISLLNAIGLNSGQWELLLFIVGGIIGAILVLMLFDPALILLSSLAGAILISRAITLTSPLAGLVLIVLVIVGVIVQAGMLRRGASARPSTSPPRR